MKETTIASRLQAYFLNKDISMAQVSRDTGIQYDTLQQILYGRVKAMGIDKFAIIWKSYPDLDAWHILTGDVMVDPCADANEKLDKVRDIINK